MPYRRSYTRRYRRPYNSSTSKRFSARRKPAYRSRVSKMSRYSTRRSFASKVYTYKRFVNNADTGGQNPYISQLITDQHLAYHFTLSDVPNYEEFTSLYDEYKILKIVVKLMPMAMQVTNSADGSTSNFGILATVLDFNDDTPLTSIQDYEAYQNFRFQSIQSQRLHTRVFTPTAAGLTLTEAGAATSVPVRVERNKWYRTSNAEVVYYGLKLFLGAGSANSLQTYYFQLIYYMAFRNVK